MHLTTLAGFLGELLSPPWSPLLMVALGLALARHGLTGGRALAWGGVALLWGLSTGLCSGLLLAGLEAPVLSAAAAKGAGAIVILGGGAYRDAPEFGGDDLAGAGLERVRYGADVQRHTHLPVMVTGAVTSGALWSEAHIMATVLQRDFAVPTTWEEDRARNTLENARYAARLLRAAGIHRVLLVTHAWHMRRSLWAFRQTGIEVVAAPLGFDTRPVGARYSPLPSLDALVHTRVALHEYAGLAWYGLRCAFSECG